MKNLIVNTFGTMLLITLMASCEKYLAVNAQSNYVYISTVNDCQLLLDNYNSLNTEAPADQMVSSDEYYVTDASLLTLASQPQEVTFYRWDSNAIRPVNSGTTDWNAVYRKVYVANLALENINKLKKDNNSAELMNVEGQALFHRAFNFWQAAQLYAKPYQKTTAGQEPGVPVRLTPDINETISRGTLQQTYDQIIADLQKAVELLPDTASIVTRPSKAAAYGMLARVYLTMADYPSALQNATFALAINSRLLDYNQLSTTSTTPFTRFNKEVLFHVTSRSSSSILSPGSPSNSTAKIAPDLIDSYAFNDLRKKILFKINTVDAGTYAFTGNYEQVTGTSFFTGIAVDEVYLTRAECYARVGNAGAAMDDMNALLKTRFVNTPTEPYVPATALSTADALSQVLTERKKELVMRGLRWNDLRRLNLDPGTAVTLTRTVNGAIYTLPPNDLRYTLLIPTEVIAAGNVSQNLR